MMTGAQTSKSSVLAQEKGASEEWLRRQTARLNANPLALQWLKNLGLGEQTINQYHLGLSLPNVHRTYRDALVFPIFNQNGLPTKRYAYYHVDSVTKYDEPESWQRAWAAGEPTLYYGAQIKNQHSLLLLTNCLELWAITELLEKDRSLATSLLLVACSISTVDTMVRLPSELLDANWWNQFQQIYLGLGADPVGLQNRHRLLAVIPKEAQLACVGGRWSNNWNTLAKEGNVDDLKGLLATAKVPSIPLASTPPYLASPVEIDVCNTFHNGHLYWPTEMYVTGKEGEEWQSVIIRSDGAILTTTLSPRLTPDGRPILRLTDGTAIRKKPRPMPGSTWRWESIQAFCNTKGQNPQASGPELGALVEKIRRHISAQVWVPYAEDYSLIALGIAVSYCQEIFDAVPLFLIVGEGGTGKSELGRIIAELGCNGKMIGKATAAAIVDTVDRNRGLLVIDDFEEVGSQNGEAKFGDIHQILKISYKKATATYTKILAKEPVNLRCYGVKFVNNTQGADELIASRMFTVYTRRKPAELPVVDEEKRLAILSAAQLQDIKDELHSWAFYNVDQIHAKYRTIVSGGSNRSDEIAAPLKTLGELAGNTSITADLDVALQKRQNIPKMLDEELAFRDGLKNILAQGFDSISASHLVNEMTTASNAIPGVNVASPAVVGRLLKDWTDSQKQFRPYVQFGVRLRCFLIRSEKKTELMAELVKEGRTINMPQEPGAFCVNCQSCRYNGHCDIASRQHKKRHQRK